MNSPYLTLSMKNCLHCPCISKKHLQIKCRGIINIHCQHYNFVFNNS